MNKKKSLSLKKSCISKLKILNLSLKNSKNYNKIGGKKKNHFLTHEHLFHQQKLIKTMTPYPHNSPKQCRHILLIKPNISTSYSTTT